MDNTKDLVESFVGELAALESELATAFEDTFGVGLSESEMELYGTSLRAVNGALGITIDQINDEEIREAWDASFTLAKLAGKSTTKNRVLIFTALAMTYLRNAHQSIEAAEFGRAIRSTAAFASAVGNACASASEWASKSGPGRKGAAKRKDFYSRQVDEALNIWRKEISPALTANAAAEKLRVKGVGLSFDKLARVIAAEKKKQ